MSRYQPLVLEQNPPATSSTPLLMNGAPRTRALNCSGCLVFCLPFMNQLGQIPFLPNRKQVVGYSAGIFFAVGWWFFIDGLVYATHHSGDAQMPQPRFEDWLPGIFSTLGLIIVNLVDRETLNADDFSYSGSNIAAKARAFAFVGVTLSLGALGGALADLSLKYIMPGKDAAHMYFGQTITIQSFLIFLSSMVFWFGRNWEQEGTIAI